MSARLKLSTVLPLGPDVAALLRRAIALEEAGLDYIGVPEAYGIDCVSLLGYLAARTSTVGLVSGIMPIYSRTPTLIAMTAAGLDEVSQGRFELGLGVSGPQVVEGWHGVRYDRPLGRTREVIEICRSVWRRERLIHQGISYQIPVPEGEGTGLGKPLKLIVAPRRDRIPIHLAALGERNVALAAELADGWIPYLYVPELADLVWGEALAAGSARRPADLGPLQIFAGGPFALGSDVEPLRQQARPRLALYIGGMGARGANCYNDVVRRYGFSAQAAEIQDYYLAGDRAAAEAAVPEELLAGTSLIGDEAYVRDRLQAYAATGVTTLQIDPIGPDPLADVRRLRELIESL